MTVRDYIETERHSETKDELYFRKLMIEKFVQYVSEELKDNKPNNSIQMSKNIEF